MKGNKMSNFYSHVHSSWNPDRVGSCVASKPHKQRATRKPYLYAQFSGNEVSVRNARGTARFQVTFDRKVISAVIRDGQLIVTTADDCVRHYDMMTHELISEIWPTPPTGGSRASAFQFAA